MQKLTDYKFNDKNSRYDWDTILDGSTYRLVRGDDFDCTVNNFSQQARNKASRLGGKVRINVEKDENGDASGVVLQYTAPPPETDDTN